MPSLQFAIPVLLTTALLAVKPAYAIDDHTSLKSLSSSEETSLKNAIAKNLQLNAMANDGRRSYESLSDYKSRRAASTEKLNSYQAIRWSMTAPPDRHRLDWDSGYLELAIDLPMAVLRGRGGRDSRSNIVAVIRDPSIIREVATFSRAVEFSVSFSFFERNSIVVDSVIVTYKGVRLYEDK